MCICIFLVCKMHVLNHFFHQVGTVILNQNRNVFYRNVAVYRRSTRLSWRILTMMTSTWRLQEAWKLRLKMYEVLLPNSRSKFCILLDIFLRGHTRIMIKLFMFHEHSLCMAKSWKLVFLIEIRTYESSAGVYIVHFDHFPPPTPLSFIFSLRISLLLAGRSEEFITQNDAFL